MIEKTLETIEKLAPFLSSYPNWVKFLFSIWVFLSATLLLAFVFTRQAQPKGDSRETNGDAWLIIKRVRAYTLSDDDLRVRVTAIINGNEYVYPSLAGVEWLKLGPDMSPQRFRIPRALNGYEVRFALKGTYSGTPIEMVSQWVESINRLPYSGEYKLHTYHSASRTRDGSVSATIEYEITN